MMRLKRVCFTDDPNKALLEVIDDNGELHTLGWVTSVAVKQTAAALKEITVVFDGYEVEVVSE